MQYPRHPFLCTLFPVSISDHAGSQQDDQNTHDQTGDAIHPVGIQGTAPLKGRQHRKLKGEHGYQRIRHPNVPDRDENR